MRYCFLRIPLAIILAFLIVGVFQIFLVQGATTENPLVVSGQQKIADNTGGMGPLVAGGRFGSAVKGLGDLNNDGIPDLAVGSFSAGAYNLLFLKADGTVDHTTLLASTTQGGLSVGRLSITKIGDLNNDGTPELAVGNTDSGKVFRGAVQILFMKDNSVMSATTITSGTAGFGLLNPFDQFGSDVAAIGDLNQDGTPDLAVGAPGVNGQGMVYILFMKADGTVSSTVSIPPLVAGHSFGRSIAAIGDLNQDGVIDLAVGDVTGLSPSLGVVYILLMKADGTVSSTKNISIGGGAFGWSVAGVGDLNRDGIPDIAVGDYLDDTGDLDNGAIYIYLMKTDGTVSSTIKFAENTHGLGNLATGGNFGSDITLLGDVNGDGNSDLAVGAFSDGTGGTSETGAVYILFMGDVLKMYLPTILKP